MSKEIVISIKGGTEDLRQVVHEITQYVRCAADEHFKRYVDFRHMTKITSTSSKQESEYRVMSTASESADLFLIFEGVLCCPEGAAHFEASVKKVLTEYKNDGEIRDFEITFSDYNSSRGDIPVGVRSGVTLGKLASALGGATSVGNLGTIGAGVGRTYSNQSTCGPVSDKPQDAFDCPDQGTDNVQESTPVVKVVTTKKSERRNLSTAGVASILSAVLERLMTTREHQRHLLDSGAVVDVEEETLRIEFQDGEAHLHSDRDGALNGVPQIVSGPSPICTAYPAEPSVAENGVVYGNPGADPYDPRIAAEILECVVAFLTFPYLPSKKMDAEGNVYERVGEEIRLIRGSNGLQFDAYEHVGVNGDKPTAEYVYSIHSPNGKS